MQEVIMDTSPHKSDFVQVNGVQLHYLDWGGEGDVFLFLTGMDTSAHIYDRIAPRFTDRFRVLALTRRGQGESDYPESGYDVPRLTDDIYQFMDALQIEKAILAGHSLAGIELNHFAGTHSKRVRSLIYLDAQEDYRKFPEIRAKDPLKDIPPPIAQKEPTTIEEFIANSKASYPSLADIWDELWDLEISYEVTKNENGIVVGKMSAGIAKQMLEAANSYTPMRLPAHIPILRFFAMGFARLSDAYSEEQKAMAYQYHEEVWLPYIKSLADEFRNIYPHARIIEIPDGHHYCFVAQEEIVYQEMRKFLLE
jgi:pimeloyl-ACP methyl ester carboxylesterase